MSGDVRPLIRTVLLALLAGCAGIPRGVPAPPSGGASCPFHASTNARIRFYAERIREQPRLAPMFVELGRAYLDRARDTHDPAWLARARAAEAQALTLQESFEAWMAMAAIQAYAHRFVDALAWYRRAAAASVNAPWTLDPIVAAGMVEAHLGLGELDAARQLLGSLEVAPADSYSAAARAQWLVESGQTTEAVVAYGVATRLARDQGLPASAAWAEAAAAGALLDAGKLDEARAHVEVAEAFGPCLASVRLRRAELSERENNWAAALATYEALLDENVDPIVAARAFAAARRRGDSERAVRYFAVAERGLRRALDAGEVYTLGPLAILYADAGGSLEDALRLAEANLAWKRDREARRTVALIEARRAAQGTAP